MIYFSQESQIHLTIYYLPNIDISTIDVSWNRPLYTGGGDHTAIRDTRISYKNSEPPESGWAEFTPTTPLNDDINLNVTGLTPGDAYFFRARSKNDVSYSVWDTCDLSVACGFPVPFSNFKPLFKTTAGNQSQIEDWMRYAVPGGIFKWDKTLGDGTYAGGQGGIDISWVNPAEDDWLPNYHNDCSFSKYVLYRSENELGSGIEPVMVNTWEGNPTPLEYNKSITRASIINKRISAGPPPVWSLGTPDCSYRFSLVPVLNHLKSLNRVFDFTIGTHTYGWPNLFKLPSNVFNYNAPFPDKATNYPIWFRKNNVGIYELPIPGHGTTAYTWGSFTSLLNEKKLGFLW